MKCSWCRGPRHRNLRGRFVNRDPACPYTQTPFYQYTKARFYEELERSAEPSFYPALYQENKTAEDTT